MERDRRIEYLFFKVLQSKKHCLSMLKFFGVSFVQQNSSREGDFVPCSLWFYNTKGKFISSTVDSQ